MITIEPISARALKITVPEKVKADDFQQLASQIYPLSRQQGKIRLLIDASNFSGWENIAAFERHIGFVKNHHRKVERISVIAGHDWQHWVIRTIRLFVHPEVRVYDKGQARFVCQACGKRGADVRPDFNWNKFIEPDGVSLITFSQTRNPGSCVMRQSPSIVPDDLDRDVYLVLDDFGSRLGRSWRETDEADTDRATLIRYLLEGQYSSPVRVIAFNTAEGWSRDVTEEIAAELAKAWLAKACADRGEMPPSIADFIADHTRSSRVR